MFQAVVLSLDEMKVWGKSTPQEEALWRTIRLQAADQMVTHCVSFVVVMDPAGHILRTVKLDVVGPAPKNLCVRMVERGALEGA